MRRLLLTPLSAVGQSLLGLAETIGGATLLFSRILRNLKQTPPLMNVNYPIGKENAVVGGVYL